MFDRLEAMARRYEDITMELGEPDVAADQNRFRSLMKEQSDILPILEEFQKYKNCKATIADSEELLGAESDDDMREMLKEELAAAKEELPEIEKKLKILMLPKDPNDDKNVIVEIRAGAGGDEAALFAADMYRVYTRYADRMGWRIETMSVEDTGIGGMKSVNFSLSGQGAYSRLKFESGVHRVQRIPATESGGRIHTSTITVAIMPEVEDVEVEIDMNDCKFDVFRASGNGGQCVNTTDSAVRLTHIPTGIVISCQDEKSQIKNKAKALKVLRAKLYDLERQKAHDSEAALRKSQVGTGDRSEKIRTYNFHQGRVTDHRIGLTLYKIDAIMNGDLDELIDALTTASQAEKLAGLEG
ncbi:MAG: peptide chain release factor 1 [Butyrivibrio sp.]|nr:peptide chain release factor 1 [Butyrivibrio sp.]